ncbi:MAG TPA: hypothetical protein VG711_12430 [Phycisphaerales bacterium]|nr:hypothetical protein [Phycisphaerales bacterium]
MRNGVNQLAVITTVSAALAGVSVLSGCDGKSPTPPSSPSSTTSNSSATQPGQQTVVMGASSQPGAGGSATQPGLAPTAGLTTMEKSYMLPPSATQKDAHEGLTEQEALAQSRIMMAGDFDRSLPLERYSSMGFPSPDLVWGPSEYLAAASALKSMEDVPQQYPRYGSPNSGKLFARMTDDANLASLRDKTLPLEARFSSATRLTSEFEKVFAQYNRSSRPGSLLDDETLELADFQIRLDVDVFNLIRESAAVIPTGNPARATLSQKAKDLQIQAMAQLQAYFKTYGEDLFYLPPALERFSQRLEQHLPALYPYLVSSDQQTVRGVLEQIINNAKDEKVKAATVKALAALPPAKTPESTDNEPLK